MLRFLFKKQKQKKKKLNTNQIWLINYYLYFKEVIIMAKCGGAKKKGGKKGGKKGC